MTLFPFLAVLVCAMGALIFLLIVATQRIRRDALARAEAVLHTEELPSDDSEPPVDPYELHPDPLQESDNKASPDTLDDFAEQPPEPEPQIDPTIELQEQIAELSSRLEKLRAELERETAAVVSARDRSERRENELAVSQQRRREIDGKRQQLAEDTQQAEFEQHRLQLAIVESKQRLERLKQQKLQAGSLYAIIPYEGTLGTTRRPILIECSERGFRFLREDVVLSETELEGFTATYNPLLAGARSLIEYYTARQRRENEPEPYVLLVVRPGGSFAFYAARRLLAKLGQPFGYELMDSDEKLELPHDEPRATAICREAVETALASRETLVNSRRAGRVRGAPGVRFRRGPGGFDVVEKEPSIIGGKGRSLSGRQLSGRGERVGFGLLGHEVQFDGPTGGLPAENQRPIRERRMVSRQRPISSDQSPRSTGQSPISGRGDRKAGRLGALSAERADDSGSGGPNRTARGIASTGGGEPGDDDAQESRSGVRQRDGLLDLQVAGVPDGSPDRDDIDEHGSADSRFTNRRPSGGSSNSTPRSGGSGDPDFSESSTTFPTFDVSRRRRANAASRFDSPKKRRWGLYGPQATIGFEREIDVYVGAGRIAVGDQKPIRVGHGETPQQLTNLVLQSIDKEAESWGKPPELFYWVPSLQFVVSPGGNQHYERIQGPLSLWGLRSKVEYRLSGS